MAPKVGTVVRATRMRKVVHEETLEVSVVREKNATAGGKKVVSVEVQEKGGGGEEEQPPLVVMKEEPPKKEEKQKVGEDAKNGKKKKRRRKLGSGGGGEGGERGYKRYVFKVLKQVHPGMGVSSMAMTVLDGLMRDMFERIVGEATRLSKYTGKATLSSRDVQAAVRLVLPGELGKHAVAEGTKAVANYVAADRPA